MNKQHKLWLDNINGQQLPSPNPTITRKPLETDTMLIHTYINVCGLSFNRADKCLAITKRRHPRVHQWVSISKKRLVVHTPVLYKCLRPLFQSGWQMLSYNQTQASTCTPMSIDKQKTACCSYPCPYTPPPPPPPPIPAHYIALQQIHTEFHHY